jgi:hypothetical protein
MAGSELSKAPVSTEMNKQPVRPFLNVYNEAAQMLDGLTERLRKIHDALRETVF